ncbi:MAG: pseudouridine synthase [Arenimonas sp.]|jgi:23S rRNA pseudouridine2605 synthase
MSDTPSKKVLSLKDKSSDDNTPKIEERLHKVLAQAGLGSRRALEERIGQGLVKVNGEVAKTGQSVSSGDRIELDGKTFVATALTEPSSVLIYNKPEGQVTTREDPEGRPTIFEALPRLKGARWIAVGRLDMNTTGLLLLTTDGELANALMHPSNAIEREYVCRIPGEVPDAVVDRLARGVALEDGPAKFEKIERINASGSHSWFQVVVTEGRNREVRRLWESQGHQVSRLKRVRYGDVTLPRLLKRGHCVEMAAEEVEKIRKHFGLENNPPVLTLQPVIGQRKSRPLEIRVGKDRAQNSYVNGHVNEEARELRRFDHVREEKRPHGRGRPGAGAGRGKPGGGYKGAGGKPFSGPMGADRPTGARPPRPGKPFGAKPAGGPRDDNFGNRIDSPPPRTHGDRPFSPRGPKPQGDRPFSDRGPRPAAPGGFKGKPHSASRPPSHEHNTAEFRSWYVPEGVETGSKVAPPRSQRPSGPRPYGDRGPRPQGDRPPGARGPRPQGDHPRGPKPHGDSPYQARGPRPAGDAPPRGPRPQGDSPYQPRGPKGPRPAGDRPSHGPRPPPHGERPFNDRGPRPEGPRGPRKPAGPRPPFRKRPDGLPSDD